MGFGHVTPVAAGIPYDNSTDGWIAEDVQAAIEEAPIHLRAGEVHTTSTFTLSATPTLIPGITTTPVAGTYLVWFSDVITVASVGAIATAGLYVGGTLKADSVRAISPFDGGLTSNVNAAGVIAINALVTVNGSQAIQVRASTSTGTATCGAAGTMNWLRTT